jgi:hypothetical protein
VSIETIGCRGHSARDFIKEGNRMEFAAQFKTPRLLLFRRGRLTQPMQSRQHGLIEWDWHWICHPKCREAICDRVDRRLQLSKMGELDLHDIVVLLTIDTGNIRFRSHLKNSKKTTAYANAVALTSSFPRFREMIDNAASFQEQS